MNCSEGAKSAVVLLCSRLQLVRIRIGGYNQTMDNSKNERIEIVIPDGFYELDDKTTEKILLEVAVSNGVLKQQAE